MAIKLTANDRQMIKWLEKTPIPEEVKKGLIDTISQTGLTDDVVASIHKIVAALEGSDHTRYLAELTQHVNQWRMSEQARHFRRR
jgi:hypothetical protein